MPVVFLMFKAALRAFRRSFRRMRAIPAAYFAASLVILIDEPLPLMIATPRVGEPRPSLMLSARTGFPRL